MVTAQEKQKILQQISEMSMDELLDLSEYTLRAIRNLNARGFQIEKIVEESTEDINVYLLFETEFGRPMSPFEIESINVWIDQDDHKPTLIKAALREAVMARKLSLRYIDRILFDWKKNGIKTVEEAREHSIKFNSPRGLRVTKATEGGPRPAVPFYNWLES